MSKIKVHNLKIDEEYLENLLNGSKKVEIRLNDRDYQRGDILEFYHYDEEGDSGDVYFRITHIHSGLGMEGRYVALSVERCFDLQFYLSLEEPNQ